MSRVLTIIIAGLTAYLTLQAALVVLGASAQINEGVAQTIDDPVGYAAAHKGTEELGRFANYTEDLEEDIIKSEVSNAK